jgi:hypothetical protein
MFTTRFRPTIRLLGLLAICAAVAGLAGTRAAPAAGEGDDFASQELGAPWDMSDPTTFAFEYTRDHGDGGGPLNVSLSGGVLSATATTGDPRVTLLVPSNPLANPVPPEGGYRPIDAGRYRYLSVQVNVPADSLAQVFWQTSSGQPFGFSQFQQLTAGPNTITIDLAATGPGSGGVPWSGLIQGLYFDPMMSAGAFQIDYVRLSSAPPANPANGLPQLKITAPSFISGPDYAASEVGNAWDMSDPADVFRSHALGPLAFNNGVLDASTGNCSGADCGDPQVTLKVGPPINTSKYKYVTYRMQLDNTEALAGGAVARFLWWSTIPQQSSTTADALVYDGFRTVSFDLTQIRLDGASFAPWASSAPIAFRFDPHEYITPHTFHLDYVMLTGDSTADASYAIRYEVSDADGDTPTTEFFYDTDTNRDNGAGTAIVCGASAGMAANGFNVYLPLVKRFGDQPPVVPSGSTCNWDTSSVPAGAYYIYGVANDGADATGVYSQTPVVVSH